MEFSQSFAAINRAEHRLKEFDCGKPGMNQFIQQFACKHSKLGLSRTMVLPVANLEGDKRLIAACFTLAIATVQGKSLPVKKSLPKYPTPVALLARLAVDLKYQNKRLGEKSLISALRHAARLCDEGLPAYGLILDVLDKDALSFYQRYDIFHQLSDDPMRLFAPMSVLRKI